MSISIRFQQWAPQHPTGNRQTVIDWTKQFVATDIELALGYMYGLNLLRPRSTSITIMYQGKTYKNSEFLRSPMMQPHLLTTTGKYWVYGESLTDFLFRNRHRLKIPYHKQYLIMLTEDDTESENQPLTIIQFDNISFLQGFLSILEFFHVPTIRHIVAIFDVKGTSYTLAR